MSGDKGTASTEGRRRALRSGGTGGNNLFGEKPFLQYAGQKEVFKNAGHEGAHIADLVEKISPLPPGGFHPFYPERAEPPAYLGKPQPERHYLYHLRKGDRLKSTPCGYGGGSGACDRLYRKATDCQGKQKF